MTIHEAKPDIYHGAVTAITEVLGMKEDETILIITNPDGNVSEISQALYQAAKVHGTKPVLVYQEKKSQLDMCEDAILGAIGTIPDVIVSMSAGKLGKDRFRIEEPLEEDGKKFDHIFTFLLGTKKIRGFWSPGVTTEIWARTVPIDYKRVREEAASLKKILDTADSVRITAPAGTDLTIGLRGRETKVDDGDFMQQGTGGNLPCGEAFISPELGTSNGTIAFDGSISLFDGDIIINDPILCSVVDGFVTDVTGGEEAEKLGDTLRKSVENAGMFFADGTIDESTRDEYIKNATNLGELGIGLNPEAVISGNMLEDEKAYHTCHIAIGSNYDNDARALTHLDGLVKEPTMVAVFEDGSTREFMKDGTLIFS
jgi:aminopeptidase